METWNQRLRQARLARGFDNLTAFARSLGVKAPTAHNWESGATKELKGQNLINVCQKLQITHQWLLDGKGDMDDGLPATIEAKGQAIAQPPIPSVTASGRIEITPEPSLSDLLDALSARLEQADPSVRDEVMRLVLRYMEHPQSGARIVRAIEELLGSEHDHSPA